MTSRKVSRKKDATMSVKDPISAQQKAVTHWLRRNVPTKKTKFLHSHVVEYFLGSKAVDALINDSPWSKEKAKEGSDLIFECREYTTEYLDELLKHKMYHRAKKIPVADKRSSKENSKKPKDGKESESATPNLKDVATKRKRKIRLDMHLDQIFLDSQDAYVWLYDPIPWYYWVGGSAIVLGIIAVCLFPLWPPLMRKGVHYFSLAAGGFLVLIIAIAIVKYIIFSLLFLLSGGKLKFWIFPNLTEDVGFLESFVPVYDYTYIEDKKKKKKAKDSDDEESDDDDDDDEDDEEREDNEEKESDDSTSKKSSTGKDFEIVSKNDTDLDEEGEN